MTQDTGKFRTNVSDKFYTRPEVAATCVSKIMATLGERVADAIWIEPSAGSGTFVAAARAAGAGTIRALDLDSPKEVDPGLGIEQRDFLSWNGEALGPAAARPRLFFGNPPFGRQSSAAKKFLRHCATLEAAWITFILPRSFEKPSMQRAIPANYHLLSSTELPTNSFLVNGQPYEVPCVFQVWERRDVARPVAAAVDPAGFTYVKDSEKHHLVIRRVGGLAGNCYLAAGGLSGNGMSAAGNPFSPQSHYFIQISGTVPPVSELKRVCSAMCAWPFPSNTTGPRSLSKPEITAVLNPLLAAAGAADADGEQSESSL
jgi:hypothetical protein